MTGEAPTMKREEFTFQAEMQQLLELIIHSLYQHKDIFLRELISNASDALNKVRVKQLTEDVVDKDAELGITLSSDEDAKTLTIRDNGIGMTREELIENLGTVARSGTKGFLTKLKEAEQSGDAKDFIGQFGVGFYSAFMVAKKIVVRSLSATPGSQAVEWSSEGGNAYTIAEIDKSDRGTEIILHLREDDLDYAKPWRIETIISKYSKYVGYPIRMGDKQLNETEALWTKPKSEITEEEYKAFYSYVSHFGSEPLHTIHVSIDSPIQYHALLYIPSTANMDQLLGQDRKGIKLYCRKVFVHDNETELLPPYLRFLAGVVDSEDLPLNVSREVVQSNPVLRKISRTLTGKVLSEIESIAKNDTETYAKFWKEFSRIFKEGLNSDFERRDRLVELLRYESTEAEEGELVSLAGVVERMKDKQEEIVYVSAESRERALQNPKLELFRKAGVEVLLFLDPIDEFVIGSIPKYKDKPLVEIDQARTDWLAEELGDRETADEAELDKLIAVFKEACGERVEDIRRSDRLVDAPCALVSSDEAMSRHMEKMMKLMNKDFEGSKRVLEVNPANPIIRALSTLASKDEQGELVRDCALQLFEDTLLLDGELVNPNELVRRDHRFMEKLLGALTG